MDRSVWARGCTFGQMDGVPERMREAGVPDGVTFATKWELMLGLIDQATQNDEGNPHLGWDSFRLWVMQGMACPSCVENSMCEGVRTSWR